MLERIRSMPYASSSIHRIPSPSWVQLSIPRPILLLQPLLLPLLFRRRRAILFRRQCQQLRFRRSVCRCLSAIPRQSWPRLLTSGTHPPPVMIFPRRRSSSRYSSIVIVGNLCELLKTSIPSLSRSDKPPVLVRMVNGCRTLPPPEISWRGLTCPCFRSSRHVLSSSRVSRGAMGPEGAGADARRSSSIWVDERAGRVRPCRRRRRSRVTWRVSGGSSWLTEVEAVEVEITAGRVLGGGRRERMNARGVDGGDG